MSPADDIEDFCFLVTHLPCARNGAAWWTGDSDAESQQELFSRLGRGAPAPAVLAAV